MSAPSSNPFQRSYQSKDIVRLAFIFLCINITIIVYHSLHGNGFPLDSFLFDPNDRFGDFFRVIGAIDNVTTFVNVYPPFIYYEHVLPFSATYYIACSKLIQFTGSGINTFLGIYLLILLSIILVARRNGNKITTMLFALCSYPMIFAIDRGNLAIVVFLSLLWALSTKKIIYSTFAIAVAVSFKLTPIIFLVPIFLNDEFSIKRIIRVSLFFLAWFFILNLIAILINGYLLTPHEYNPIVLFGGLGRYMHKYVDAMAGLGYGSSLYMPTVYFFYRQALHNLFVTYVSPITLAAIVCGWITILWLRKKGILPLFNFVMERQKMTFLVCICFVLFTPVTGDYYLLIMLLPLLVYPNMYYSFGYFFLYGALLGAKTFFYVDHVHFTNISIQVFLNPLLLLFLLFAEFNLIPFARRNLHKEGLIPWKIQELISQITNDWKRKASIAAVVLIITLPVYLYYRNKTITKAKFFASSFYDKEWSYSTDDGVSWIGDAAGGLEKFDNNGRPVHKNFVWGIGEWKDDNTIVWISLVGSKAIWKAFSNYSKESLSEEQIIRNRQYATTFKDKVWYYSVSGGIQWEGRAEGGLKEFDEKGRPIHVDPVWRVGKWKGEDTILWVAINGAPSIWKGTSLDKRFSITPENTILWKEFSKNFGSKKWHYSVDGGKTWQQDAESGLKEFDENGRPVHIEEVWGTGNWEDENRIRWVAVNGSISFWKGVIPNESIILTEEEIDKAKVFSKTFGKKEWYYSVDDGKSWQGRAENGLKGFDENGSPIHVDSIWGKGKWENENTIRWIAKNGSESIWKALETPPD